MNLDSVLFPKINDIFFLLSVAFRAFVMSRQIYTLLGTSVYYQSSKHLQLYLWYLDWVPHIQSYPCLHL